MTAPAAVPRIMLDRDDVYVLPIGRSCLIGNTDGCTDEETHQVEIETRNNGSSHGIVAGCKTCCEDFAARLRGSLPERANEDGTQ